MGASLPRLMASMRSDYAMLYAASLVTPMYGGAFGEVLRQSTDPDFSTLNSITFAFQRELLCKWKRKDFRTVAPCSLVNLTVTLIVYG